MKRYSVKLNDRQSDALDKMAKELDTSKTNLFAKALSLLELALREKAAGNQIGVVRDGKVLKEVIGV